jgi:hypothetical protein
MNVGKKRSGKERQGGKGRWGLLSIEGKTKKKDATERSYKDSNDERGIIFTALISTVSSRNIYNHLISISHIHLVHARCTAQCTYCC